MLADSNSFSSKILRSMRLLGPLAIYQSRVAQGLLRPNRKQLDSVQLLQDLSNRLVSYSPPPIIEATETVTVEKLASPDFKWQDYKFNQNHHYASRIKEWLTARPELGFGPRGLYLYGVIWGIDLRV